MVGFFGRDSFGTGPRPGYSTPGRFQGTPLLDILNKTARGVAGTIQSRMGSQAGFGNDYIQELYETLYGPMDQSALQGQASSMAAAEYGPQIQAIRNLMRQQEEAAVRGKEEVGRLFNALSGEIRTDVPRIKAETEAGKRGVAQEYQASQDYVANLYKQMQQEQMDLFNKLDIQAAAPDAMAGQGEDEAWFKTLAEQQKAQTRDYLTTIGAGNVAFTRQGAQMAQTEGTQRQADISQQLADLLGGYRSDIAGLQGQQRAASQSALAGLISSGEERQHKLFQDQLDMAKFLQSMEGGGEGGKPSFEGIRGVRSVADQYFGKGSYQAGKVAGWVGNWVTQDYEADPFSRVDPNQAARKAVEAAQRAGFKGDSLVAVRDAVYAYFGKF